MSTATELEPKSVVKATKKKERKEIQRTDRYVLLDSVIGASGMYRLTHSLKSVDGHTYVNMVPSQLVALEEFGVIKNTPRILGKELLYMSRSIDFFKVDQQAASLSSESLLMPTSYTVTVLKYSWNPVTLKWDYKSNCLLEDFDFSKYELE